MYRTILAPEHNRIHAYEQLSCQVQSVSLDSFGLRITSPDYVYRTYSLPQPCIYHSEAFQIHLPTTLDLGIHMHSL